MKSIKTYQGMRRFKAGILIPVSLVGIIHLAGCKLKESVPMETMPIPTIEVEQSLPYMQNLQQLQAITKGIINIDIRQKEDVENSISLSIHGISKEKISEDAYEIWNRLLEQLNYSQKVYIHLTEYQNQIDFTKLNFDQDIEISIFLKDSQQVQLEGLEEYCNTIHPNNSSVQNIDEVAQYINQNGGSITFDGMILKENFVSSIQQFFVDSTVPFSTVNLFAFNVEEEKNLSVALSNVKTDMLFICECKGEGELVIPENTKSLVIAYSSPNLKMEANTDTYALIYENQITTEYLNSILVQSLQNISILDLHFNIGPYLENVQDYNVKIRITPNGCVLFSMVENWELLSYKKEDGTWKMEIIPKTLGAIPLAKIL